MSFLGAKREEGARKRKLELEELELKLELELELVGAAGAGAGAKLEPGNEMAAYYYYNMGRCSTFFLRQPCDV